MPPRPGRRSHVSPAGQAPFLANRACHRFISARAVAKQAIETTTTWQASLLHNHGE